MKMALVFAVLVIGGGIAILAMDGSDNNTLTYQTLPVERGEIRSVVRASGTVKAVVTVEVSSQLSGRVAKVFVDFNDEVTKDQPIAQLDPRTFEAEVREARAAVGVAKADVLIRQAAVEQAAAGIDTAVARSKVVEEQAAGAKAAYDLAKRDLERKKALAKKRAIAESEIDQSQAKHLSAAALLRGETAKIKAQAAVVQEARAALRIAEAELTRAVEAVRQREAALELAEVKLERTTIRSPVNGIVIGRDLEEGQTVAASLEAPKLFVIAQDLRQMEIHVQIDEADIGRIRLGQNARFSVDSYPNRTFTGTVIQVRKGPADSAENKTAASTVVVYTVLVSANNPDLALSAGMTASVEIVVDEARDVLKLPNAVLRFRPPAGADVIETSGPPAEPNEAIVWTLTDDGRPLPVKIQIGPTDDRATEVRQGELREGQQVIVGYRKNSGRSSRFGLSFGF